MLSYYLISSCDCTEIDESLKGLFDLTIAIAINEEFKGKNIEDKMCIFEIYKNDKLIDEENESYLASIETKCMIQRFMKSPIFIIIIVVVNLIIIESLFHLFS